MSPPQKIGVTTATIVGMNAMIGAGVFSAPATLASTTGPVAIVTYIFVMIAVWLLAISLSRVAQLFPEEGSFYAYAKQWGGHPAGILASASYIAGLLIAMGLLAQLAGNYLHEYVPVIPATPLSLALLFVLIIANIAGAQLSQIGQMLLICTTVFPILATSLLCLTKINPAHIDSLQGLTITNILSTTKLVIFGFFGFEAAASLFSVIKNPQKAVPKALTYSITLVGLLYLLFIGSIILATPLSLFSHPKVLLSTILLQIFPDKAWLITLIHFAILSAIIGTLHSMIWSASTLISSLAKKTNLHISQKAGVLIVGSCITLTSLFLKSLDLFFSLTAALLVFAYGLAIITLLFIPSEWKSGRNAITLCGLATALAMMIFAVQGILIAT
jgi:amino acid transporter